jgi:hypothetical protein
MRKLNVSGLISVPALSCVTRGSSIHEISSILDQEEYHTIERMPWALFPYKPEVSFSIAYTDDCILLKYYVQEKAIRVVHNEDNTPVHEDSCVEFFIAFDDDQEYYNLEFNCGGTCLVGYGKNSERQLIRQEIIRKIRRQSVIQCLADKEHSINWELTLVIPLEIFVHRPISHLKENTAVLIFINAEIYCPSLIFLHGKISIMSRQIFIYLNFLVRCILYKLIRTEKCNHKQAYVSRFKIY